MKVLLRTLTKPGKRGAATLVAFGVILAASGVFARPAEETTPCVRQILYAQDLEGITPGRDNDTAVIWDRDGVLRVVIRQRDDNSAILPEVDVRVFAGERLRYQALKAGQVHTLTIRLLDGGKSPYQTRTWSLATHGWPVDDTLIIPRDGFVRFGGLATEYNKLTLTRFDDTSCPRPSPSPSPSPTPTPTPSPSPSPSPTPSPSPSPSPITLIQVIQSQSQTVTIEDKDENGASPTPEPPAEKSRLRILSKTDHQDTIAPGGTLTYEITVRNESGTLATEVRVIDLLPEHLTPNAASVNPSGTVNASGRVITWRGKTVPAHAEKSFTVEVKVKPSAPNGFLLRNVAEVSGPGFSGSASDTTLVVVPDVKGAAVTVSAPRPVPLTAKTGMDASTALLALGGLLSGTGSYLSRRKF